MLLRTTYAEVSKEAHKPALLAKGLTEEEIEMLDNMAGDIVEQNDVQQNAKKARLQATIIRIEMMNAVWEKMSLVCMCAKMVFQNDAARYNLFLLTDGEPPKSNDAPQPD